MALSACLLALLWPGDSINLKNCWISNQFNWHFIGPVHSRLPASCNCSRSWPYSVFRLRWHLSCFLSNLSPRDFWSIYFAAGWALNSRPRSSIFRFPLPIFQCTCLAAIYDASDALLATYVSAPRQAPIPKPNCFPRMCVLVFFFFQFESKACRQVNAKEMDKKSHSQCAGKIRFKRSVCGT